MKLLKINIKKRIRSKNIKIGGFDELNQYIEIKNSIKYNKLNKNFLKHII